MPTRPKAAPGTLVLFVRHGRTPTTGDVLPGRTKGLDLSDAGREQAAAAARRIAESSVQVDAIYSSPLERCRQTAAPLAKALRLPVRSHRGLVDLDVGEWTGLRIKDLAKTPAWQTVQRNPSAFRFPDGESFLEMQARVSSTVAQLVDAHTGGTIVLFSHADPIKAVIATALGTPLDLFQRISISPCSVSAVRYTPSGPYVLAVNVIDNLGDLQPS